MVGLKPIIKDAYKEEIKKWIKNHMDVFEENEFGVTHWWYVQNLLGDLLDEFSHSEINDIKDEALEEKDRLNDNK